MKNFSKENGIKTGEQNLAKHLEFCPKRPKFNKSHYFEDGILFVLWQDEMNLRKFRFIPFCEI